MIGLARVFEKVERAFLDCLRVLLTEHHCGGEVRLCHKRAATCSWNEEARERVCMISSGRPQVYCANLRE
jgi:hypothetical protein